MNQGRIIVITGAPGTGKTTTASAVAKESDLEKSVHMHTDDFYHYLSKGAIPPHLPESNEQNLIVIEAFLEAAKRYARGGYDVIVDGIIGPWFLKPWQSLVREHYEVHYIILRASKEETLKRAVERSKLDRKTNIELVETMWEQFSNLGIYELNVIDTTTHSIKDTVSAVQEKIASKRTTLVEESELTHVADPDNPTKEFENRQERFALYRAMQQLDAETREVIHLRLAGDFSFRDIGDILGHSEVWARVRFYRGKEKLVKIIGGDNNA